MRWRVAADHGVMSPAGPDARIVSIGHDRRMVEPPATPHRERWLHFVRDGESESAPPPDDDPPEERAGPRTPSVFTRTPPGGPGHGGWAPPIRRAHAAPNPDPLPDGGRDPDAGSGTHPTTVHRTLCVRGYGSLAEPPRGRPGIVAGAGRCVAGADGRAVGDRRAVRRRSASATDALRAAAGGWALPGVGSGLGRRGPASPHQPGRPGRRRSAGRAGTRIAGAAPAAGPRRRSGRRARPGRPGGPGSPRTAVRGSGHSRCRGPGSPGSPRDGGPGFEHSRCRGRGNAERTAGGPDCGE
jgi:hypothetical protein